MSNQLYSKLHSNYGQINIRRITIAKGWGRRPIAPDRIDFDPDKQYRTPNPFTTARDPYETSYSELETIAYWILRDDVNALDSETGKRKGLKGDNTILFPEHNYQRRRREILNQNGVPEPELVQGSYWRQHPEGRKVNSEEARARGAGYYR